MIIGPVSLSRPLCLAGHCRIPRLGWFTERPIAVLPQLHIQPLRELAEGGTGLAQLHVFTLQLPDELVTASDRLRNRRPQRRPGGCDVCGGRRGKAACGVGSMSGRARVVFCDE